MSIATLADATGVGTNQANRERAMRDSKIKKATPLVCFVVPFGAELPEQLKLTPIDDLASLGHIAYQATIESDERANLFLTFVNLDDLVTAIKNGPSFRAQFRVMLGVPKLEYPAMFNQATYNLPVVTWNELVDKLGLGESARFDASLPVAGGASLGDRVDEDDIPMEDGDGE